MKTIKLAEPLADMYAFSTSSASRYAVDIGKSPSISPYIEYKVTGRLLDGYRIVEKYFKLVNLDFKNKICNVVQIPTPDSLTDIQVCSLFIVLKNGKVFTEKHRNLFDIINLQLKDLQCRLSFVEQDTSSALREYAILKDTTIMLDGEKNKESAALANVELAQYLDDAMYSTKLI